MEGEGGAVYFRFVHGMGAGVCWLGAIVYRPDREGDRSCLGVRKLGVSLELHSSTPSARKGGVARVYGTSNWGGLIQGSIWPNQQRNRPRCCHGGRLN